MNTTIKLLAVAAIGLIGCGDNKSVPDARVRADAPPDAYCSDCPVAPTIGAQIDRMGRAAVNTALNHGFDVTADAQPAKLAYNQNSSVAAWLDLANIQEFAKNLAIIDVLDTSATETGCGNQALYNGGMAAPANSMSYYTLAGVLANDQLFLDTSRPTCGTYLSVEAGEILGNYTSCGGRAPEYDVIDFSYSMLAAGLDGFDVSTGTFVPLIGDGVAAHDDYLTDFPYLGPPHTP